MVKDSFCWVKTPLSLKYTMGEVALVSIKFCCMVANINPASLTVDIGEKEIVKNILGNGLPLDVDGVLVRSCPVKEKQARFRVLSELICYVPAQYQRHYVEVTTTFENYLKKFSSKSRGTLKRKLRKFSELSDGEIPFQEYKKPKEMEKFYSLAREVSEKTYQEKLLGHGLPIDDNFQKKMLSKASNDQVRGYVLFHKEKPISYLYCPIKDDIILYEYVGFDARYQRYSPGTILLYLALKSLFSEHRVRMFDFTQGSAPHKEFFSTKNIKCADIYYFRKTFKNLFLLFVHSGLDILSNSIVRMLDALKLKSFVKKFFRKQL